MEERNPHLWASGHNSTDYLAVPTPWKDFRAMEDLT
jgi:hypothetical protein